MRLTYIVMFLDTSPDIRRASDGSVIQCMVDRHDNVYFLIELGHILSEYARNVMALGEMDHRTAGLFEPKASFRLPHNKP